MLEQTQLSQLTKFILKRWRHIT